MIIGLTYDTVEDILTRIFLQRWADRTPVVLKNANPAEHEMPPSVQAWVYFTVYKTANRQDSFGGVKNRRMLRVGRVFAEVFVKAGTITGLQNELAGSIIDMYEDGSWSPMRINQITQQDLPDGAHRRASITGDGRWFGTQVNVQWAFDEVK